MLAQTGKKRYRGSCSDTQIPFLDIIERGRALDDPTTLNIPPARD
jgi:hypothetical protein